jgi:flagellar FliJ protein
MKKFKFSLQSVHRVREIRQEREMLTFSDLQLQVEKAVSDVRDLESLRLEAMRRYAGKLKSREEVSPLEMELSSNHFAALNRRQQDAERELAEKNLECSKQGEIVADAMREVKITDKLKETHFARYERERERTEQNGLDELVSTRYGRKGTEQ